MSGIVVVKFWYADISMPGHTMDNAMIIADHKNMRTDEKLQSPWIAHACVAQKNQTLTHEYSISNILSKRFF